MLYKKYLLPLSQIRIDKATMEQKERDILLQKFNETNRKLALVSEQLEIANKKLKEYEDYWIPCIILEVDN